MSFGLKFETLVSYFGRLVTFSESGKRKKKEEKEGRKEERKEERREIEEIRKERREEEKRRNNESCNLEKQADNPLKLK